MIRKTAIATVAVAALALGTASATSLGTFDDVAFAASDLNLLDCELASDAVSLVPVLPALGDIAGDALAVPPVLPSPSLSTATALVGALAVDLTGLDPLCLADAVLTIVALDADGDVLSVIDAAALPAIGAITAGGVNTLDVTTLGLDVADIYDFRLVLS